MKFFVGLKALFSISDGMKIIAMGWYSLFSNASDSVYFPALGKYARIIRYSTKKKNKSFCLLVTGISHNKYGLIISYSITKLSPLEDFYLLLLMMLLLYSNKHIKTRKKEKIFSLENLAINFQK